MVSQSHSEPSLLDQASAPRSVTAEIYLDEGLTKHRMAVLDVLIDEAKIWTISITKAV